VSSVEFRKLSTRTRDSGLNFTAETPNTPRKAVDLKTPESGWVLGLREAIASGLTDTKVESS
jgi:hypothetical protein